MKIAISTDGDYVSAHFGRCPSYNIFEIENDSVINREIIDNPGHSPGFLPEFLHKQGVEYIISGGMGRRAMSIFNEVGIKTIVGITGRVDETIDKILKGTLEGGESLCEHGSGKGHSHDKECNKDK